MGESVAEATLTTWLKEVGDSITMDEAVFEIATDKVDSEVPSEVEGILVQKLFQVDDVIQVGQTVAIIETKGGETVSQDDTAEVVAMELPKAEVVTELDRAVTVARETVAQDPIGAVSGSGRFYSPLVRNIAQKEGISQAALDAIPGTGSGGRVTKNDVLGYLAKGGNIETPIVEALPEVPEVAVEKPVASKTKDSHKEKVVSDSGDEVVEMTRMGKLIAKHMVESVATSAHVQSFVEVDVTNVVRWREGIKAGFEAREGEKLTYTPIFLEAVAKALKKYPMMNISVQGDTIIKRKNINIGMAAALPDGNLIVPVIKNADRLNLVGMARTVNDLALRARNNELKPDEVQDGTYTVTNVGTFGSVFGTPIINQPQVGILALGAIRKVPAVIETPQGDLIGVRSKMFLSHSYDHRVVNGALGGMFVRAVADYLEAWDTDREI